MCALRNHTAFRQQTVFSMCDYYVIKYSICILVNRRCCFRRSRTWMEVLQGVQGVKWRHAHQCDMTRIVSFCLTSSRVAHRLSHALRRSAVSPTFQRMQICLCLPGHMSTETFLTQFALQVTKCSLAASHQSRGLRSLCSGVAFGSWPTGHLGRSTG